MDFGIDDIQKAFSELPAIGTREYTVSYAKLFYKTMHHASREVILQIGAELLRLRPKELSFHQKRRLWSSWNLSIALQPYYSDIERFYTLLSSKVLEQIDFSQCCGVDISGLNLAENKTVTRELIEGSPDLSGVTFPAIDLTGCDLRNKPLSDSDLSRVTGLKPENLFPDYSGKTWNTTYIAKSYNGVKFPEMDMTGVPTKYLLFKNCAGLKNGNLNTRLIVNFEKYLQSQERQLSFGYRAFSSPFIVPDDRVCFFTDCDLRNATFTNPQQFNRVRRCQISLETYKTFFMGDLRMERILSEKQISCPELDSMVADLVKAFNAAHPELSIDKNRIWQGEREEQWDIIKLHDTLQTNPAQFARLVTQLFILTI